MMVPLSLKIALRFSQRHPYGILCLMSSISIIAIGLGIAVLIISLSVMNGFEQELNDRILSVLPHGEIEPKNLPFPDWPTALKRIEEVPDILVAAPYLNFTGIIQHGDKYQAVKIKGVDPVLEMKLSTLPRYIKEDILLCLQSGRQKIIIGKGMADALKVKSGDFLTVIIPSFQHGMKLLQPKRMRLQVSGIAELSGQLDRILAMVALEDAQEYLQKKKGITGISIKVKDAFNANKLVQKAGAAINFPVKTQSWMNTYGYMYRDIQMIRSITYLAMFLVMGLASFNVVSTLVMVVKDKIADVAVLRTLGAKNKLIFSAFIWYSLIVYAIGSSIGTVVGILTAFNLTALVKKIEYFLGHQLLSGNVYFIDFIPAEPCWEEVAIVLATALFLSLLASWYPAYSASRIHPARILSGR